MPLKPVPPKSKKLNTKKKQISAFVSANFAEMKKAIKKKNPDKTNEKLQAMTNAALHTEGRKRLMEASDASSHRAVIGINLFKFLKDNPKPSDADVHTWAEENGYAVNEVESLAYIFAAKLVELLTSGKSAEKGITSADVDQEQLAMGVEVEKEHTPCVAIARKIALDHLAEAEGAPHYTLLKEMEDKMHSKG